MPVAHNAPFAWRRIASATGAVSDTLRGNEHWYSELLAYALIVSLGFIRAGNDAIEMTPCVQRPWHTCSAAHINYFNNIFHDVITYPTHGFIPILLYILEVVNKWNLIL